VLLLNSSEAWLTLQLMRRIKSEGFSPSSAPGSVVESSSSPQKKAGHFFKHPALIFSVTDYNRISVSGTFA